MAASSWTDFDRLSGVALCGRLGGHASPSVPWDSVQDRRGQSIFSFTSQRKQSRVRLDGDGRSTMYPVHLPPIGKPRLLVAAATHNAMAVRPSSISEG
jgi:hypothetical protein